MIGPEPEELPVDPLPPELLPQAAETSATAQAIAAIRPVVRLIMNHSARHASQGEARLFYYVQ
ncbi:MAG: hypothetical protein ACRDRJ_02110 [Streptosporangiaceae bacterium]